MQSNPAESRTATITAVAYGRTILELDHGAWTALGLGIGERCMVEAGDDTCAGEVTDRRVVTLALSMGSPGDRVRVRRPRLETCSTGQERAS